MELSNPIEAFPRRVPCPVCQMPVNTRGAEFTLQRGGRTYFFCTAGCREAFLQRGCYSGQPKGWWGRYLERLARVNQGLFGNSGPQCH